MKKQLKSIFTSNKCHMYKMKWTVLLVFVINLLASAALFANDFQDKDPIRTRMSLTCIQLPNHQIKVQVKLRAKPDKQYVAVPNVEIEFFNLTDSTEISLGKGITDPKGLVEIIVDAKEKLSINEDGYYNVMGSFDGNDDYKSSDNDLLFKPAILKMEAEVIDSVNTITINLFEDSEEATPLEDVEVFLQVPRMFSNLPIASESTDEEGKVSFEFPNDLPGGENGELTIIAKVEDTDEHASLQVRIENNWGVPFSTLQETEKRELWTPNAPLWMVLTFALLMTLVWGHFIVIIYKLILIKKEGKTIIEESN